MDINNFFLQFYIYVCEVIIDNIMKYIYIYMTTRINRSFISQIRNRHGTFALFA